MSGAHDRVKPGLDQAASLEPGHGWVAAEIRDTSDTPLEAIVEVGYAATVDVALYGDVWAQPTLKKFGGDVGLRYKKNLDLFAGGWSDLSGNYGGQAGLKWRF